MTTLEDLYYGNISPWERDMKRGSRMDKLVKLICKNEESLMSTLTEQQKETFERFKDCQVRSATSRLARRSRTVSFWRHGSWSRSWTVW